MNQIFAIKGNTIYRQLPGEVFKMVPELHVTMIHSIGTKHEMLNSQLISKKEIVETTIHFTATEFNNFLNQLLRLNEELKKVSVTADGLSRMGENLKNPPQQSETPPPTTTE